MSKEALAIPNEDKDLENLPPIYSIPDISKWKEQLEALRVDIEKLVKSLKNREEWDF